MTTGVFAWLLALALSLPASGEEPPPGQERFQVGFSSTLFSDVNENDARAAVKAWAQTIIGERGIPVDADPRILSGLDRLTAALQDKQVDMVAVLTEEYRMLCRVVPLSPLFIGIVNGMAEEEMLLVVYRDSGIEHLADLKGRRLTVHHNARTSLGWAWLNTLLWEAELPSAAAFFGQITENARLSSSLLPVFFRQSDAGLITRNSFDTMAEMNPQLGKQLHTLAASPLMIPVLLGFRADYAPPFKDDILTALRDLHLTPSGQQVLTVFRSEKLEERPAAAFHNALELLEKAGRLQRMNSSTAKEATP